MDFPFDTDKTAYATVYAHQRGEYAHLYLSLNLPELRHYSSNAWLQVNSQVNRPEEFTNRGLEPFYAIRLEAHGHGQGLEMQACERALKAMRRINGAVGKIDAATGAPAELIEDIFMRYIIAAKVSHVYCARHVNSSGGIPSYPLFEGARIRDGLRWAIRCLKGETLKSVNRTLEVA